MRYQKGVALAVFSVSLLASPYGAQAASAVPEPGIKLPTVDSGAKLSGTDAVSKVSGQTGEFYLHKIVVETGEVSFKEADIEAITQPYTKQTTNMAKLNAMTEEITRYLHRHGYPAATAYIPEQEIIRSTLQVRIMPGKLGKVNINNKSALSDKVVTRLLKGLRPGDKITSKKMETALYNINDLAGVTAAGLLSPGADVGSSDLTVTIKDGDRAQTLLYAENYGNRNTGRYRYGLQETLSNLSRHGDMLRIGTLISNKDLRNYYAGYETNVGRSGSTVGISLSHMNYETGLEAFGMNGKADTISLYGKTPLFHTARHFLAVTYGYDYRRLRDEISRAGWDSERHSHAVHVGLTGLERKQGSALGYDITVTQGTLGLDSDHARFLNALSHFSGAFTKLNWRLNAVQDLGHRFDVLVKAQGQFANKNLDSSERMYLGGAQGVRAYPQGEGSGDQGVMGTVELRYHTKLPGLSLSMYLDGGEVKHQKEVAGSTSLTGWGVGVTYSRPNDWFARFDYARRIGGPDNLGQDAKAKGRMWFIAGKIF